MTHTDGQGNATGRADEGPPDAGFWYKCPTCSSYHQDDDAAFQSLVKTACHALDESYRVIVEDFDPSVEGGRWGYDGDTGLMTFTEADGQRWVARFHRVGTWVAASGSFMWHWGQGEDRLQGEAADHARACGNAKGMKILTSKMLWINLEDSWHLAKTVAHLSGLRMTYRVPVTDRTWSYFALERPKRLA